MKYFEYFLIVILLGLILYGGVQNYLYAGNCDQHLNFYVKEILILFFLLIARFFLKNKSSLGSILLLFSFILFHFSASYAWERFGALSCFLPWSISDLKPDIITGTASLIFFIITYFLGGFIEMIFNKIKKKVQATKENRIAF